MTRRHVTLLAICACLAFAAGCDRAPTNTTAGSEPLPADTSAPAEPVERINPAIVLVATPNPADFCGDKKLTTVTVNWDTSAANVPQYSIWVEAPNVRRKSWLGGSKPVDSKQTGPWVRDQTKFSMIDNSGTIVATTTVTAMECGVPADAAVPAPTDATPPAAPPSA